MNKATHTPGPWVIFTSNSYRRIGSESTGHEVVSPITQADGHPDTFFPNGGAEGPDARLITAAPDLLEACREAVFLFAHGVGAMSADTENRDRNIEEAKRIKAKVEAAIAKAGGLPWEAREP